MTAHVDYPHEDGTLWDCEACGLTGTPLVTTWSSYGHRFISSGDGEYDDCLTCGAQYRITPTPDEPWDFKWTSNDGSEPRECSGDTMRCHGYERACVDCDPERDGPCQHESHDCNCVVCE